MLFVTRMSVRGGLLRIPFCFLRLQTRVREGKKIDLFVMKPRAKVPRHDPSRFMEPRDVEFLQRAR